MKRGILTILVVSLLLAMTVFSVSQVNAQSTGNWITKYTITDLTTGAVLLDQSSSTTPVLAGTDLNVTMTIVITASNPGQVLTLTADMDHSATQNAYWDLQSKSFPGIDATTYNPNQQTVSFNQTIGTLVISCYGSIAKDITQSQAGSIQLDKPVTGKTIVSLTDPANNQLANININIVDDALNQFANQLASAQGQVQALTSQGVDPAYIALYKSVINTAVSDANAGLINNAISDLNSLQTTQSSSQPTTPTGTPIEATLFLPAVVALVVIVLLIVFLFVRTRGKVTYDKMVIEDQIRDLEGLTLRAAKIDRNLTASLESVKDRLKNLVEV